jgi:hypothetical protein
MSMEQVSKWLGPHTIPTRSNWLHKKTKIEQQDMTNVKLYSDSVSLGSNPGSPASQPGLRGPAARAVKSSGTSVG